jgi:hypothetical protein
MHRNHRIIFGKQFDLWLSMKTKALFLALVVMITGGSWAQSSKPVKVNIKNLPELGLRNASNKAFKPGEKLVYRLHYGLIDAATATISVDPQITKIDNREVYHVIGEGRTISSFDYFFKVRDKYESYIDKQGMFPHKFVRRVDEGGYKINQDYEFYPAKRAYKNQKGEGYLTPEYVQDMISAFYFARNMDFSKAKKGDIFKITCVVDDEIFNLKIRYIGKENIETDAGKFKAIKFAPVIQKGRIFKKEEDLSVWISDDNNHIPLMASAKIMVGSVKMELKSYSGLANSPAIVQ